MSKLDELPVLERPREKAMHYGVDSLSNEELLAVLIRTGTRDESVLDIAHKIYSDSHGLSNLFHTSYQALLDINGIGPGKALTLSACFELCNRYLKTFHGESGPVTSEDIYHRYSLTMLGSSAEMFILVVLNRRREIIHEEKLYVGSEYQVTCQPSEIVKKVILHGGAFFYMVHNHPSGDTAPSKEDVDLTTRVYITGKRVNVTLLDHIIVGNSDFYSFAKHDKTGKMV